MIYRDISLDWYMQATEDEKYLAEKVESFAEFFSDMLFSNCDDLPDELRYFSYDWVWFKVKHIDPFEDG